MKKTDLSHMTPTEQERKAALSRKNTEANRRWRAANPGKQAQHSARYKKRHPDRARANDRRQRIQKYGITVEQYNQMIERQGGVCAVKGCGNYGRLLIDHNHETGEVRGLLCYSCNTALGLSRDDPVRLRALALYVETAECDTLPHTPAETLADAVTGHGLRKMLTETNV